MNRLRAWIVPPELSTGRYFARLLLVVVQIVLAYCLAGQTNPFFYQAF
jgi:hypothetical protein